MGKVLSKVWKILSMLWNLFSKLWKMNSMVWKILLMHKEKCFLAVRDVFFSVAEEVLQE
ncbi:MAG: hypothetical protein IKY43_03080 [Bacteroidales bacterium]|nr:hypothetical protein [Bacteroidales bacterium]